MKARRRHSYAQQVLDDLERLGRRVIMPSNCPICEFTADGIRAGRCWMFLPDGKTCSRHGDVSGAVEKYKTTGELTNDPRYAEKEGGGR